jgi:hypothetical protein
MNTAYQDRYGHPSLTPPDIYWFPGKHNDGSCGTPHPTPSPQRPWEWEQPQRYPDDPHGPQRPWEWEQPLRFPGRPPPPVNPWCGSDFIK